MKKPGSKLSSLQAGRGLAAFAVLLFHAEVFLGHKDYLGHHIFKPAIAMHFGVHYFFVLSGFLMTILHWGDLGNLKIFGKFISRRFVRIYPPLWCALFVAVLLQIIVGKYNANFTDVVLSVTAFPVDFKEPFLAVEWTLRHEILFYIFFSFIMAFPKFGLPFFGVWCLVGLAFDVPKDAFLGVLISPYNCLFLLGVLVGLVYRSNYLKGSACGYLFALGAIVFSTTWFFEVLTEPTVEPVGTIIGYGIGSCLMLLGAVEYERHKTLKIGRFLSLLGDASYSLYLVHLLAISAAVRIFVPLVKNGYIADVLAYILTVAFALTFSMVFYYVFENKLIPSIRSMLRRVGDASK